MPTTHKEYDRSLIVFVIDDDDSIRSAMTRLLRAAGLDVAVFANVDEFLENADIETGGCIVAEVRMPGTSGLALPGILAQREFDTPVIFVTAYDSDQTRADARCAGAAGYFRKPIDERALLDAINWSICPAPAASGRSL